MVGEKGEEELMEDWKKRTEIWLGKDRIDGFQKANVWVVGVGGVGAYAAEMICRAGVGKMTIVDGDIVQPTNINRQLPALSSTIGQEKARLVANRLKDINPDLELTVHSTFLKDDNIPALLDSDTFDFVVDAIDTLSPQG